MANERIRENLDGNACEMYHAITDQPSRQNSNELFCSMCSKRQYLDNDTYAGVLRRIEMGLDNPVVCNDCRLEFDELAYFDRD